MESSTNLTSNGFSPPPATQPSAWTEAVSLCGKSALLPQMVTQRKSCLDNPNKPPKALRAILAKRRKKQKEKLKEHLTPALETQFAAYRDSGKPMSMTTVDARLSELADALERALDGEYDGTTSCAYCEFEQCESLRERAASDKGQVSNRPP